MTMTPEQQAIIEECERDYPNINGLEPSLENGQAIEEFLAEHRLRLDGDIVVVDERA